MSLRTEKEYIKHIFDRHPELGNEDVQVISSGHQNLVLVIGQKWIFRFPLTRDTSSLEREQKLLPKLSKHLPLPIPSFQYSSRSRDKIVYVGYPIIQGTTLEKDIFQNLPAETQEKLAQDIAAFLTKLHTFTQDKIVKVNRNEFCSTWRKNWTGYYRALEMTVFPHIGTREQLWIMSIFHEYLVRNENFTFRPCLIHGDFKNDHIFVDTKGRINGIIDFGQMKMGDPSYDYHDLFLTYGSTFAHLVFKHYQGPKDSTLLDRCRNFYAHVIRFSSLINAINNKDKEKWERRLRWLKEKAREV